MFEGLKPCPHRRVDESGNILCGWIKNGDRQVSVNLCRACPVSAINCEHLRAALHKNTPTPITVRFATGRVEVWNDEAPSIEFKQAACAAKTMPIHSPRDCQGCPLRVPQVIPAAAIPVARPVPPPESRPMASASAAVIAPAPQENIRRAQAPAIQPPRARREPAPTPSPSALHDSPSTAEQGLVERARSIAARKQQERQVQAATAPARARTEPEARREPTASRGAARGETKSKIILLQEWLADQVSRRNKPEPPAPQPDEDGVQEIVYSPIAPVYQEEPGLERCVGWTD